MNEGFLLRIITVIGISLTFIELFFFYQIKRNSNNVVYYENLEKIKLKKLKEKSWKNFPFEEMKTIKDVHDQAFENGYEAKQKSYFFHK